MAPTLVVMAAGMGSRYGGLKQVEPVGPSGETLLDYSVFDAARAGFAKVVFVIRRDLEEAFRPVVARYASRLRVGFAFQELEVGLGAYPPPRDRTKPWGTGHAVLAAEPAVESPFGVINADDFYGAGAFLALAEFLAVSPRPARMEEQTTDIEEYAMVAYRLGSTLSEHGAVARGVCETRDGLLVGVEEVTSISRRAGGIAAAGGRRFTGKEPVSLNVWGFTPAIFPRLRSRFAAFLEARGTDPKAEFFLPSAVTALIDAGLARVHVLTTGGSWFGVTYRDDLVAVARSVGGLVAAGVYPTPLWRR